MNQKLSNQYDWMGRLNSSYGFAAVLTLGLQDGLNVCAISLTILFMLFLLYYVRSVKKILLCGLICQMFQTITCVFLVHGKFDVFLSQQLVFDFVRIFYAIAAVVFFIMGFVLLRDWYIFRFKVAGKSEWVSLPPYPSHDQTKPTDHFVEVFKTLFFIVISMVAGVCIVMLSSYAIQDYAVFIMLIDSITRDEIQKGEQAIIQYSVSLTIPFIVMWVMTLLYSAIPRIRHIAQNSIPMIKILASSVFISLGVGFVIVMIIK